MFPHFCQQLATVGWQSQKRIKVMHTLSLFSHSQKNTFLFWNTPWASGDYKKIYKLTPEVWNKSILRQADFLLQYVFTWSSAQKIVDFI